MDRRQLIGKLAGYFTAGCAGVALGKFVWPEIDAAPAAKCIVTMPVKVDFSDPAWWRPVVIKYGKAAVGTDEKGEKFQSFLELLEWIKTAQGCPVHKSYGRVFGGVHGNRDIVDTIWVALGNDKPIVFYSPYSVVKPDWMSGEYNAIEL